MSRPITEEVVRRICCDFGRGMTSAEVARRNGVGQTTALAIGHARGVKVRSVGTPKRKKPTGRVASALVMVRCGRSISRAARAMGISVSAVYAARERWRNRR